MDFDEKIRAAVLPIVPACQAGVYTGDASEYAEFNLVEMPALFGDNGPEAVRALVQLHYYSPLDKNTRPIKKALVRALVSAGFTYPAIEDATDLSARHLVFEFEDAGGVDDGAT